MTSISSTVIAPEYRSPIMTSIKPVAVEVSLWSPVIMATWNNEWIDSEISMVHSG